MGYLGLNPGRGRPRGWLLRGGEYLFDEDVGVARVPCQLFDHVKPYPVEGHLAAAVVNESVGRIRSLRDASGTVSSSFVFCNHLCERLFGIQ